MLEFCGESMVRKTKEEAENTRREILKAALEVFYQKGYSRTTIDEIAARINLTKGAVYWHFKNKPDLLVELIKEHFFQKQMIHYEVNTWEDLRNAMVESARRIHEDPEYRKFLFFVIFQMEWSEAMVSKVGDSICGIRGYPLLQLQEALKNIQNNGFLDKQANIEELSLVLLYLWKGALGDEIGKFSNQNFPEMIAKSVDLIAAGVKKERS